MVSKKNYYYFWQYTLDFLAVGTLKSMIADYNKKEKYLGYFMKCLYEDLITYVINDLGKIPTIKNNKIFTIDEEKMQIILSVDQKTCSEFVDAIIKYDLVIFDSDKESYYLKNIERFIGSNKTYKRSIKEKNTDAVVSATMKQKRMFAILKNYGYTGTLEQFTSGSDRDTVKAFIEATMNSNINLKEFFKNGLTKEDYLSLGIDPKLFNGKIID